MRVLPGEVGGPLPDLLRKGSPLLDRWTQLGHGRGVFPDHGPFSVVIYGTCGEATIVRPGGGKVELDPPLFDPVEAAASKASAKKNRAVNRQRAGLRATGRVRRYASHNDLSEMMTLTYATVPEWSQVSVDLQLFWRRFRRSSGYPRTPYAAVVEWGKATGRLHLHVAVDWWQKLQAVEVCELCARPALRRRRSDIPPAGSFCVGCLWGHGFVGAPEVVKDAPGDLSAYLSKYLTKDLAGHLRGLQRYRLAEGFSPVPEVVETATLAAAFDLVADRFGERAPFVWSSFDEEGWRGPLSFAVRYK